MHHYGFWGMGWMWFFWTFVIVAVVVAAIVAARSLGRSSPGGRSAAEETLRERYAPGEISRDEYERKLKDVRQP